MYSKKKAKKIFDFTERVRLLIPLPEDDLILIEDPKFAVHFSGSDVCCIPIKFNKKGVPTGYDLESVVMSDRWFISNEAIYEPYMKKTVVIAVSLQQLLWRTAPDWSMKNHRKHFR